MARLRWVRDVYGQRREIARRWPDGSYECPFCAGPVRPARLQRCGNPACNANPSVTLEIAQRRDQAERTRRAEQIARERIQALRYR